MLDAYDGIADEQDLTRVSWRRRGELLDDLNTYREMIVERLPPEAPGGALAILAN